jgi:hypothetical protein
MDNARANPVAEPFKTRAVKEQGIRKGPALMTRPRMNHKPRRFVQNDHVPVFIQNRQGYVFRLARDRFWRRDLTPDKIVGPGQISGLFDQSIDGDVTGTNQPASMRAGKVGQACSNDDIEAMASI